MPTCWQRCRGGLSVATRMKYWKAKRSSCTEMKHVTVHLQTATITPITCNLCSSSFSCRTSLHSSPQCNALLCYWSAIDLFAAEPLPVNTNTQLSFVFSFPLTLDSVTHSQSIKKMINNSSFNLLHFVFVMNYQWTRDASLHDSPSISVTTAFNIFTLTYALAGKLEIYCSGHLFNISVVVV